VRDEYTNAVAEASVKLQPGPFPSPEAATAWANAAASRWTPLAEPISVAELFPNASGATASENEGEYEYLLTEGQTLFLTMCACGDKEATSEKVKDIWPRHREGHHGVAARQAVAEMGGAAPDGALQGVRHAGRDPMMDALLLVCVVGVLVLALGVDLGAAWLRSDGDERREGNSRDADHQGRRGHDAQNRQQDDSARRPDDL
jgi:hypothetical protein